jgi:hypothetical protein
VSDNYRKSCQVIITVIVLNATFNNIPVISWRSVLLVEETGVPGENPDPDIIDLYHNSKIGA